MDRETATKGMWSGRKLGHKLSLLSLVPLTTALWLSRQPLPRMGQDMSDACCSAGTYTRRRRMPHVHSVAHIAETQTSTTDVHPSDSLTLGPCTTHTHSTCCSFTYRASLRGTKASEDTHIRFTRRYKQHKAKQRSVNTPLHDNNTFPSEQRLSLTCTKAEAQAHTS